jgi:hypothetical protein
MRTLHVVARLRLVSVVFIGVLCWTMLPPVAVAQEATPVSTESPDEETAKGESPQEEPTSGPGNSDAAKACQQGGYANLVGADGTQFANTGECVSYAARGGTLLVDTGCRAAAAALGLNPDGYTIILGTEGSDVFDARVTGGPDLICGFGGEDKITNLDPGDVFLGGSDSDFAAYVNAESSFYGEGDIDYVLGELQGGTVFGGADDDEVDQISSGTFNGEDGDDSFGSMDGGTFNGGGGADVVGLMFGGTFNGGADNDLVSSLDGGTFNGEAGDDSVWGTMTGGTFNGGAGNDSVNDMVGAPSFPGGTFNGEDGEDFVVDLEGGTFNGGPDVDTVTNLLGGTFNQD